MSKTSLRSVGSPHTWPSLLAALAWLIELLCYDETVQLAVEENDIDVLDGGGGDRMFFDYLRDSCASPFPSPPAFPKPIPPRPWAVGAPRSAPRRCKGGDLRPSVCAASRTFVAGTWRSSPATTSALR